MLSDMGTQFTSGLMSEVSGLVSMKHLTTTPYHPICNGLVEKFNGTLKQMLRRLCHQKPKDWDKYINAALFAYREVPHESLGFSPFELVYGRHIRRPMTILKELWTNEVANSEVKSTYQYVTDLREKLELTSHMARENLREAASRYCKYYNRKTRTRSMKVGDKVLVLLPTDTNKLLMRWKGLFPITEKLGTVDYRIDMHGVQKTFHANLLKLYVSREPELVGALGVIEPDEETSEIQEERVSIPEKQRTQGPEDVHVSDRLSPDEALQVKSVLQDFIDVLTDVPGLTNILEHKILTNTDTPVRLKPYPFPYAMNEVVKEEVESMLQQGFIEPSESPYSSPIVIIKKKDGSNRFCIDMRALNNITVFDAEPIPNTEVMFTKLAGCKYFSKLDLSKGKFP